MKRRLAVVASAAVVALAVSAAPAAAHPNHPHPRDPDWCGAENMRSAGVHMRTAMDEHTAPQGDAGMHGAVANRPAHCR